MFFGWVAVEGTSIAYLAYFFHRNRFRRFNHEDSIDLAYRAGNPMPSFPVHVEMESADA